MNSVKNKPKRSRFGLVDWILVMGIALLVALFLPHPAPELATVAAPEADSAAPAAEPGTLRPPASAGPPGEWGIEVVALYPAVNGRVLDLRYKVLDVARAAKLPDEPGSIYLIDQATGQKTALPNSPKTGSIPQNRQKLETGRTYSLSFPNPGGQFKSGSKLTLVMGGLRADNLTVQ